MHILNTKNVMCHSYKPTRTSRPKPRLQQDITAYACNKACYLVQRKREEEGGGGGAGISVYCIRRECDCFCVSAYACARACTRA